MQQRRILVSLFRDLTIVTLLGLALAPAGVSGQSKSDIIQFYWERAGASFRGHNPDSSGLTYVLHATTFYRHVNRKGEITGTDTTVARYFYSWGKLDSVVTVGKARVPTKDIDLSCPNIFANQYHLNFFPNDTGGPELAIGFANDSVSRTPTGLLLVDRNNYVPLWLYLYYPRVSDYKRFTRSFRFTQQENYVFPDSVWEVGAIAGVFTQEYYRIETGIDTVIIKR